MPTLSGNYFQRSASDIWTIMGKAVAIDREIIPIQNQPGYTEEHYPFQ
jgi:hypothetical protein